MARWTKRLWTDEEKRSIGFALTVLTSESLTEDFDEEENEEQKLIDSWAVRFR